MTARKTLPKDLADEVRKAYEEASKEADSMDGAQVSAAPAFLNVVTTGSRGSTGKTPRDRELEKMSPDQREDDIVEKGDWYRRPILKSGREEQDARHKARQEMNKLKSSGGPR